MDLAKLRKPFTSIFDIFDVLKLWNLCMGIACFTSIKRTDGVVVHFYDKGDQICPIIVTAISLCASSMMFFCKFYPNDATVDDIFFKGAYCLICLGANVFRFLFVKRIHQFLKAFRLIEEIDDELRKRRLSVDHEEIRKLAKKSFVATIGTLCVFYFVYYDKNISDDIRLYHFISFTLGASVSIGTMCLGAFYQLLIALTIRCRLESLNSHLAKLKSIKNSKIVEQELQMISVLHFKLCQSWKCISNVTGLSIICIHWLFYTYCFYPLCFFGYILARMRYEAMPVLVLMFFLIYNVLIIFERLRGEIDITSNKMEFQADELKQSLVGLNLERGRSDFIIKRVASTLLLQMEHIQITLTFCGFFVADLDSLLSGIKSCSVYIMFFLQMSNEMSD